MVLFRIKPLLALIAAWTFVPVIRGGGYHDHCDTIAEIACAGYYDMLCKAIKETQLYHRLDDKHQHFTAFFPTDTAIEELLDYMNVGDVRDIPIHTLEEVILLHLKGGPHVFYKDDLKHKCSDLLKMATGDYTRTVCKNGNRNLYQKGAGNLDDDRPQIIKFDREACNGVIHTVDEVILPGHLAPEPGCQSITEIACNSKDFTVLCEALIFTELDDDLDGGSWTVFGPTDDSFYELIDRLELNSTEDLGKEKLTELLLYHAVPNELKFDDLQCGDHLDMASGEASLTNCNVNNGHVFQKGCCNSREDYNVPRIIQKDVKACNGYIQVVEDVLLPGMFCEPTSAPSQSPTDSPTDSPSDSPTNSPTKLSCDDPRSLKSIAEVACTEPNLTTLCDALTATTIDVALDSDGSYTAFLPTNDAFDLFGAIKLEEILADTFGELSKLLLYHVANGIYYENQLECGLELVSLLGTDARFTTDYHTTICLSEGRKYQVGNSNLITAWPLIINTDIETCNGIVHLVNNVIIPRQGQ